MNPTLSHPSPSAAALAGLGMLAFDAHHLLGVVRVLLIRFEELPERIEQMGGMVS